MKLSRAALAGLLAAILAVGLAGCGTQSDGSAAPTDGGSGNWQQSNQFGHLSGSGNTVGYNDPETGTTIVTGN
jgi:hypothetical protein